MIVFPAIDIIEGECVRLVKGNYNLKRKYHSDPLKVALMWKEAGAQWLHVIDLDGARYGIPKNLEIAVKIKKDTGLKIQYGGGIRNLSRLNGVINAGIDRAIISTAALEDSMFLSTAKNEYGERFILSVDFDSSGVIYKHGWQSDTKFNIFNFLPDLKSFGIDEIIITNISRDGTLGGIDIDLIKKILEADNMKLIVAGGISGVEDIIRLKAIESSGVTGVIIGKALYEGKIKLEEALKIAGRDIG